MVNHEARAVHGHRHVGEHELDALERPDGLAELAPLLRVADRRVQRGLRDADRLGADGRARAVELVDRVGLSDRIRHRPTELSGGQAQRVAIARSMVNAPSLILLDEPTGAVDTETAQQLIDLMKRLNREDHVTIVIVTHDLDIAAQATRRIRLKDGTVLTDERVSGNGATLGVSVASS